VFLISVKKQTHLATGRFVNLVAGGYITNRSDQSRDQVSALIEPAL
jgi:hypothetical protein